MSEKEKMEQPIWLFGATSDNVILTASMAFYKKSGQLNRKPIDWDNKWPGVRLLLARQTKDEELARYTPKGLIFINEWGPLRHAANHAFLAFISTKLDLDNSDDLLDFAKKQMFYIYGDGGRSYIVGFGKNYPTKPHHRSSSCPVSPQECGWDVADDKMSPNPLILFGALVGGPDRFDSFINNRKNHQQSEVTLNYNAALVGGTAGLLYYIDLNYLTGV
ncbi:Oidioi.mRNA.OKI2018_I69.XSR.g16916.t1.cds [Oikopleura dioica]|uniref:cellulase n=1 Tax=Oikopleura dioica TaxID=34765 RepID=A0ABN7SMB4_OIKDI|nr:Oidioi.mRNA.OKI2018_I69.XSR.g16916.t1.cds [Oikopleura dioica]